MGRTGKIQNVLRLMRPRHYIKNLLILVSVTFDRNLFRPAVLAQALLGFGAFCLLASAVYVLNDIRDVEADRQHEIKRARPIASGAVAIPEAWGWRLSCWPPRWPFSWRRSATGGTACC